MSNIFDDIYKKKLNLNFRNLNYKTSDFVETKLDVSLVDDETLDVLFNNLYNKFETDDVPRYTENEIKIIDEKIKRNRKEAKVIRDQLTDFKNEVIDTVKNKAFVLNIKGSNTLKRASNNIFGGNKTEITYEDYLVLLEMKQQIILNEASDILSDG